MVVEGGGGILSLYKGDYANVRSVETSRKCKLCLLYTSFNIVGSRHNFSSSFVSEFSSYTVCCYNFWASDVQGMQVRVITMLSVKPPGYPDQTSHPSCSSFYLRSTYNKCNMKRRNDWVPVVHDAISRRFRVLTLLTIFSPSFSILMLRNPSILISKEEPRTTAIGRQTPSSVFWRILRNLSSPENSSMQLLTTDFLLRERTLWFDFADRFPIILQRITGSLKQ